MLVLLDLNVVQFASGLSGHNILSGRQREVLLTEFKNHQATVVLLAAVMDLA